MTKCPRDYETAINKQNSAKIKKLLFLPSSQWDNSRRWGAWYIPTSCTEDHELIPQPWAHLQVQCQKLKTTLFNPPDENLLLKYLFNHQREKPDDEPEDNVQLMQSMGSQWSWISLEQATHCNFKLPFKHWATPQSASCKGIHWPLLTWFMSVTLFFLETANEKPSFALQQFWFPASKHCPTWQLRNAQSVQLHTGLHANTKALHSSTDQVQTDSPWLFSSHLGTLR